MPRRSDFLMASERRDSSAAKIAVRPSGGSDKPVRRTFPGPRDADAPLRVAIERGAYADLIAHAKASLEAEVCGVLVGQICEDDEGPFVHVEAIIRGSAASGGATHVTFTQATWDAIHETLEHDFPKLRIVGWYHTHPGFGVEFSEMDLFIQRNFFAGPGQIALVTDPLSGAVAIAVNLPSGIDYLARFWVDSREQTARVPAGGGASGNARSGEGKNAPAPGATAVSGDVGATVKALEARVSQLIQAHDDQRASFHRFLYTIGFLVCIGIIAAVGYTVYSQYTARFEPPKLSGFIPVPIQLGDKTVLVGLTVAQWEVPPEMNAMMIELAKAQVEQERKLREAAAKETKEGAKSPEPEKKSP